MVSKLCSYLRYTRCVFARSLGYCHYGVPFVIVLDKIMEGFGTAITIPEVGTLDFLL